jgi:hypothetical protein
MLIRKVTLIFVFSQALKVALTEVRFCSRVEELLLKKKSIAPGDSMEIHSQKACICFMFITFFDVELWSLTFLEMLKSSYFSWDSRQTYKRMTI